jgi:EAL domain-containing protein (putative c-di-GMP-specific phosphodiesterase class I)
MGRLHEEAGVVARALFTRRMAPALAAVLLLIVVTAVGIVLGYPDWITPIITIAIGIVGVMFGMRGGFAAAFIASAAFLAWGIAHDGYDSGDIINGRHVLFFALGLLTGYFAYGSLGDYRIGRAVARSKLRHAIKHGQVVLHYQPVAEADTGKVIAMEALARWEHPQHGTVLPAEFIPTAEDDTETIWELTMHTLRLAVEQCGRWQRDGYEVGVAVNLSVAAIDHRGLAEEILQVLSDAGLEPDRLTLEVTESAVMDSPELGPALERMRSADSASIAIDDFGIGHSSLARLEELPVDSLKIDQSFSQRSDEERRKAMLKSIIDLAHQLDLTTCAEGVEDRETWDLLIGLGCDTVQGYAIARPMPADRVEAWLDGAPEDESWEQPVSSIEPAPSD